MAAMMKNQGTIIANDIKLDRIKILAANLERCGVMNVVACKNDGVGLCERMAKIGYKFDKILLDAPCSGEGTLRSSPKTFMMWNPKVIKKLSRGQKKLFASCLKVLKKDGEIVYSTCTHAPEEDEEIVDFALKNFPISVEKISLPMKCRSGVSEWNGDRFHEDVKNACRIYPQDNDSEGFFVCKFKLMEEVNNG
jgi:16S rRNA C967 or C1407 C5-methylase (RsmB/RsmF family)